LPVLRDLTLAPTLKPEYGQYAFSLTFQAFENISLISFYSSFSSMDICFLRTGFFMVLTTLDGLEMSLFFGAMILRLLFFLLGDGVSTSVAEPTESVDESF
jgi:hypothetical protein